MRLRIQGLYAWVAGSLLLHGCILTVVWSQSVPVLPAAVKQNLMQVQISTEAEISAVNIPTENHVGLEDVVTDHVLGTPSSTLASSALSAATPLTSPYISGRELEQSPYLIAPIVVPYPETTEGKPTGSVTLTLYVGLDGVVDRVEVSRSDLPVEFGRVAIQTFQGVKTVSYTHLTLPTKA